MNTLEEYFESIVAWNVRRSSTEDITALIADGHFFQITREMYDFWVNINPEYIHAYIGVETVPNPKAAFLLIDSTSDSNPDSVTVDTIKYAPYRYGFDEMQTIPNFSGDNYPNMNVSILSGLERSFRWILNRKMWIENKVAEGASETAGIFQAIHIPFSDLQSIFAEADVQTAVAVFGLMEDNKVELLVWSDDFSQHEDVEDVSLPIPPFKNLANYNLLRMALNI